MRAAAVHRLDKPGKMRRARRHAGLHLDEVEKVEAETARKIRPAVVIGDDRHALERRERRLPCAELLVQARDKCRAPRLVVGGVIRIDPRQRLEKRRGDDLGILRIEPVMRVAAAMGVAVARPDAHPAKLEHRDAARRIDVERAAAGDLRAAGLRKQAVEPRGRSRARPARTGAPI